jgi:hypothetical protein
LDPFTITIKSYLHDITEILLKVLFAAITQRSSQYIILNTEVVIFFIFDLVDS